MRVPTRRFGAVTAVAVTLAASPPLDAQSVDDCMRASPARAVTLCRSVIDAGRADADVWTQLALSLSKGGDAAAAERTIAEALRRYPGDADLVDLRERLATDRSEAARLERATERNTSAVALGQLKLECRLRTGRTGIDACRAYLERTDVDGVRIRARLAELERDDGASDAPPATASVTAPAPTDDTRANAESGDPASTSTAGPTPAVALAPPAPIVDPGRAARRERVAAIQGALDALGLPVGTADGIAGQRTMRALERFESATGTSVGRALDERTLAALENERTRLDDARDLLGRSRRAADDDRVDEARALLARAESSSALLEVPSGYRAELRAAEAAARDAARDAVRDAVPDAAPDVTAVIERPDIAVTVEASGTPSADASPTDLLVQIGMLERALSDARTRSDEETRRLRRAVTEALAR